VSWVRKDRNVSDALNLAEKGVTLCHRCSHVCVRELVLCLLPGPFLLPAWKEWLTFSAWSCMVPYVTTKVVCPLILVLLSSPPSRWSPLLLRIRSVDFGVHESHLLNWVVKVRLHYIISKWNFFFVCVCGGTGGWTQGFVFAAWVRYHLNHSTGPFCADYF
jgi:hypothetical protein